MSDRSFEPPSPRRAQRKSKRLCELGALCGSLLQNQKLLTVFEKAMRAQMRRIAVNHPLWYYSYRLFLSCNFDLERGILGVVR
jgi:hypothetical protein